MDFGQLGVGAVIGAIVALAGTWVGAFHRTRGARRDIAARVTQRTIDLIPPGALTVAQVVQLQAQLYVFYFRAIKAAEEDRFSQSEPSEVIRKYLPKDDILDRSLRPKSPCPPSTSVSNSEPLPPSV